MFVALTAIVLVEVLAVFVVIVEFDDVVVLPHVFGTLVLNLFETHLLVCFVLLRIYRSKSDWVEITRTF